MRASVDNEVVYGIISGASPSRQTVEDQLKEMTLGYDEREEQESCVEESWKKNRGLIKGIGKSMKMLLHSASSKRVDDEKEAAAKTRIAANLKKCRSVFFLVRGCILQPCMVHFASAVEAGTRQS